MKTLINRIDLNMMSMATIIVLSNFIHNALQGHLESNRLARSGYALITSGCSISSNFPGNTLSAYLLKNQLDDGGWADVEETIWCLAYLKAFGGRYKKEVVSGQQWLSSMQLPSGAWGKSNRDIPRIPTTALMVALVPEVANPSTTKWIYDQWAADMESATKLTYKGAFFLIAMAQNQASQNKLIDHTINYLVSEQEDNGGFAPWKDHPIGSDPWSTGVVLWGLSAMGKSAPLHTIEKALSWLKSKQLPSGFWPYHYLDDAAAMVLVGISNALNCLPEQ